MSETHPDLQTPTPRNKDKVLPIQSPIPTKTPFSLDIKSIIRRKVSSYVSWHLGSSPPLPKPLLTAKKSKPPPRQFLQYASLQQFLGDEKMLVHLYKQKMDRGLDECLYLYLKTLCLSIDYECLISERQVDQQSSVMIDALLFVSGSLQEAGAERAAFYFASIAVVYCQMYKVLHPIGEFLLIMAKIARKLFRYHEALLLLKKALEYVWWKDLRRTEELNRSFRKWLTANFPQQGELFADKFEVVRVFGAESDFATARSVKNSPQLKSMRELFGQYLDITKLRPERIVYEVCPTRGSSSVQQGGERIIGLQLQIYNEMSYNFLQLNKKEESRIFAQKYETGYVQSDRSKIKTLSSQLIYSVQRRVAGWHRISLKTFDLLFFVDIFSIVRENRQRLKTLNQQVILECFQVGFDSCWDGFFRKEMFGYEIPLPLQLRRQSFAKRKVDGRKFIVRQRSTSLVGKEKIPVLYKNSAEKIEETLILNYRGVGISRLKLVDRLERFIQALKEKERLGVLKSIRRVPALRHHSVSEFGPKLRYGE